MKTTRTTKTIILAAVILIAGTAVAFAHGGWAGDDCCCGRHMGCAMMGPGGQSQMMKPGHGDAGMGPGQGHGCRGGYAGLSDGDRAKIDTAREKFFDDTRSLRRDMDDQAYALHKEMNSDNPDSGKVAQLQKQLSKLEAEFDQKKVQHQLEMRKLWPEKFKDHAWGRGWGNRCPQR